MSNEIKFYQNNPCVIVRDVNELFCEIQLNVHFAANIEAENYCTPSECRSPMSSGEAAQEEYDQAQSIIEDIQDEEHSIICMVEKRLLHDSPIEATIINSLQKEIDKQKAELSTIKDLHAEWLKSVSGLKLSEKALKLEVASLNLSLEALTNIRSDSKACVEKLSVTRDKILIQIGSFGPRITTGEFNALEKRDAILTALEAGGVDNWDWYGESLKNANLS